MPSSLPRNTMVPNWAKFSTSQRKVFDEVFDMTWNVLAELTPFQGRSNVRDNFASAMKSAFLRRAVQTQGSKPNWFLSVAQPPAAFVRKPDSKWTVEVIACLVGSIETVSFTIMLEPTDVFYPVMMQGTVVYETDPSLEG
jgi:hypothetical protein